MLRKCEETVKIAQGGDFPAGSIAKLITFIWPPQRGDLFDIFRLADHAAGAHCDS